MGNILIVKGEKVGNLKSIYVYPLRSLNKFDLKFVTLLLKPIISDKIQTSV